MILFKCFGKKNYSIRDTEKPKINNILRFYKTLWAK